MQPADTQISRLARAWGVTLACLVAVTWRLWTPLRETPRISPFGLDFGYGELVLLVALFASSMGALFSSLMRRAVTRATIALAILMLLDQLRWQPWAYHALIVGATLAAAKPTEALAGLRLVAIAVYAFSAISKLDAEFAGTLGQQMLAVMLPGGSPFPAWATLLLPLGELAIAVLLLASLRWRRLRLAACAAVVLQHTATIFVLGPLGLGHSLGVLLWNAGFCWQTVELFRPTAEGWGPVRWRSPGLAACWIASLAPLATPLGCWDQWPGWALYAPGGERATLLVHASAVERLPESLQPWVDPAQANAWRRVRIDDWTLAATGAPIYPENRIVAAIALGLIDRQAIEGRVHVVQESAADRFSRERSQQTLTTRKEIQAASQLLLIEPTILWSD